jgi:hypothetical protein
VDCFTVREKYDPEVTVLGFRDPRPSTDSAVGLDRFSQRGTDSAFDPLVTYGRPVRPNAEGLKVAGGLHFAKISEPAPSLRLNVAVQARAARGPSSCNRRLNGNRYVLAQELGRKIRTVWPCERVVGNRELLEPLDVPQWTENRPIQLRRKIDFSSDAVIESQPQHVIPNVSRFKNVKKHGFTPTGQWF